MIDLEDHHRKRVCAEICTKCQTAAHAGLEIFDGTPKCIFGAYWNPFHDIEDAVRAKVRETLYRAIAISITGEAVKITEGLLGCTIGKFKSYIAKQFRLGMSWDNYGEWELDHIRPLSSFDLTDPDQIKYANHYLNFQPLWARENRVKSAKLEFPEIAA